MNQEEFAFIRMLLKKRSGLAFLEDKTYLLENRLLPIARACNCETLSEFIQLLKTQPTEALMHEVVDAMTTNESMFFRDIKPFEQLSRVIFPRICKSRSSGSLRIWSAACSTGQEPYSVAMCLQEAKAQMGELVPEIIATDISARVVEKAKAGIYTQFEIQRGLPVKLMLKYFNQIEGNHWQASKQLRSMVEFRTHNLLGDMAALGKFDVILCRNVLIYFDEATKHNVLSDLARMLTAGGMLMLGSGDTVAGLSNQLQMLENEHGIYVIRGT
jgi:chemotaxis protein methyltransferase CheR